MKMNQVATNVILLRHGMVEGEKRLVGHTDVPLCDEGREGVRATRDKLAGAKIDVFYSSDLSRATETTQIVAEGRGIPHHTDPDLRELNMGLWDGLYVEEVMKTHLERIKEWWRDPSLFRTPEGESLEDLKARVLPSFRRIVKNHPGQTVCVVAHGGVNRVILFDAMGLTLKRYYNVSQDYACINKIRYFADGEVVVDLVNG